MTSFKPQPIPHEAQDDLRADARAEMFFVLRNAFQHRNSECGLSYKDIGEFLDKDKGYVSRVMNGTQGSIDFETLSVFMNVMGYHLPLSPVSFEDMACKRSNYDAKPAFIRVDKPDKGVNIYSAIVRNTFHTDGITTDLPQIVKTRLPSMQTTVKFKEPVG